MSELNFCPLCGGNMKLEKIIESHGMDGSYSNWKLSCTKCGITKTYAADGFYGREYSTKEEVINDWNKIKQEPKTGYWIEVDTNMYACSNCSHCFSIVPEDNSIKQYHYCPNCEARMIELQESEEV